MKYCRKTSILYFCTNFIFSNCWGISNLCNLVNFCDLNFKHEEKNWSYFRKILFLGFRLYLCTVLMLNINNIYFSQLVITSFFFFSLGYLIVLEKSLTIKLPERKNNKPMMHPQSVVEIEKVIFSASSFLNK